MDPYRHRILDHYRHPRHFGKLSRATHQAERANPLCGDIITLQLEVTGGRIGSVAFRGEGCAISRAAASLLTEAVAGKTVAAARALTAAQAVALLRVPISPARQSCARLAHEALQLALARP
jgi:nitrogen fixation NifU-like protein